MNFRTTFTIRSSEHKINYNTPVMFIGSCFSAEIGKKMVDGRMDVLINPSGTVYNPVSVCSTLESIINNKVYTIGDLYNFKNLYVSFSHYSDYSDEDPVRVIEKINSSTRQAHDFLENSRFLFITFGTARVYRFIETGEIVSNCHKLPAYAFNNEMLNAEEISALWISALNRLKNFNKDIRVIFTISPVRHWKDGAHENQISKSVLFLGTENLLAHELADGYFPAYELVMDDLRDYRFFAEDMLHPSSEAIDYVWNEFTGCYFSADTMKIWKEVQGITMAKNHRFLTGSKTGRRDFAISMLQKISETEKKQPHIYLEEEKSYFTKLLNDNS